MAVVPAPLMGQAITHGPILGRVGSTEIGIWARTDRPGQFRVRYGVSPDGLSQVSPPATTTVARDNTGWVHITGLAPGTTYFYAVESAGPTARPSAELSGSFRTVPSIEQFADSQYNPEGLFNFSFEYGTGNGQQQGTDPPGVEDLATFRTMLDRVGEEVLFSIANGDFIYERGRDYTVAQWTAEHGLTPSQIPEVVQIAPPIVGLWENYKIYLENGPHLAAWHREVPAFFLYDDHEIINDVTGTGTPGHRDPITVLRDPAVQAWYDYVGWSNPMEFSQEIKFGRAEFTAGSDVLLDRTADFSNFDLDQAGNLHVHWGGPPPGAGLEVDPAGNPNAGVYDVVEIIDRNRVRISPPARATGTASYSIGRPSYWNMRVGNAEFFVVDTRGYRDVIDINRPFDPNTSILGARQKEWLKQEMSASDADFMFVVSTVNLSIQHVLPRGGNKDEAWTAYAAEREEMLAFWDGLGRPVFVLTGDLHNSFAIQLTDRVWEFAAGPHSSQNHTLGAERNRPPNGLYQSQGREVDIRWSTFFVDSTSGMGTSQSYGQPVYAVVKVNNVFRNSSPDGDLWLAYTRPQVIFQFYDGRTGDFLYAEAIAATR